MIHLLTSWHHGCRIYCYCETSVDELIIRGDRFLPAEWISIYDEAKDQHTLPGTPSLYCPECVKRWQESFR